MCDYGRHNYEWLNRGGRIEAPLARDADGSTRAMGWKDALSELLERTAQLGDASVKAIASPFSSNEDLAALAALVDALGGGEIQYRSERADDEIVLKGFPTLARRKELAPNSVGADAIGLSRVGDDQAAGGIDSAAAHDGIVIVLGDPLADVDDGFAESAGLFVYLGSHAPEASSRAHFVLPMPTFAEQEGSFTNVEGRVQRFWPALQAPGMARPAWLILGALAGELSDVEAPRSAAEAFALLAGRVDAFQGLTYENLGTRGAVVNETVSLLRA